MEWWIALLVLFMTFAENALSAVYTCKVTERKPLFAALIGSKIDLMGCIGVMAYTSSWEYIIPLYVGSFFGTYAGTRLNSPINEWLLRWERKQNLKKARAVKKAKTVTLP